MANGCAEKPLDPKPWKLWCGEPATQVRVVNGKRELMCPKHAALHDRKKKP